jgi:excisionase family DNA binding protein
MFLTMAQASEHLGGVPSRETLYRLAHEGHLPVRRIGRKLVISERRLEEWANGIGDVREVVYPGVALDREAPGEDPPPEWASDVAPGR